MFFCFQKSPAISPFLTGSEGLPVLDFSVGFVSQVRDGEAKPRDCQGYTYRRDGSYRGELFGGVLVFQGSELQNV